MSEAWNKWIGQVVDHKYQLQQFLGTTDHSVVFLAEFHDPELCQATIKFISADFGDKEQQLAAWKEAAQLNHAHLIRIYGAGACRIEEMDLLYVAMEHAEENLGQVLPHRALVDEETQEMLGSIVDVLVYLHDRDLVHGHVKPSNVLATGDLLKLSSDTIFPAGQVREMRRERSPYDAPELPAAPYTAADMWSLGVTLVEALTQQPAVLPFNENADPIIPSTVRDPYLEIVQHTLRRNPRLRWDIGQLAEQLNPAAAEAKAVAAVAGARVSGAAGLTSAGAMTMPPPARPTPPAMPPLTVPLSNEPAVPLAKLPPAPAIDSKRTQPQYQAAAPATSQSVELPGYVIPLFAGALLVIALIVLPFALRHRTKPDSSNVGPTTGAQSSTQAAAGQLASSASNVAPPEKLPTPKPAAELSPKKATPAAAVTPPPAPAPSRSEELPAAPKVKGSDTVAGAGEPLDKVTPTASAKALSSIHGTVRVGVKVHVDAAGNVTAATLDNPGPSRYFADLSMKAARQWVFTAPEANGHSAPSDWKIQFNYTQSGVQMSSQQLTP